MKEYRYVRAHAKLYGTVLLKGRIYRINYIGRYMYEVYGREFDVIICTISSKLLNYCFEEVK